MRIEHLNKDASTIFSGIPITFSKSSSLKENDHVSTGIIISVAVDIEEQPNALTEYLSTFICSVIRHL